VDIFLSNQVLIFLFSESILYLLSVIAFLGAIQILKNWDFNATTTKQYQLEKRAFLIVTIILFTLTLKILLLPYFAYTIDKLSLLIPGAMCGAGVISANSYGNPLLFLKIIILFFIGIWLIINQKDQQAIDYPYFKIKFRFYLFIFFMMTLEYLLDIAYFSHISTSDVVQCCSAIFGISGNNPIPFNLTVPLLLVIFYLLYILSILLSVQKNALLLFIVSLLFLYIGYESVVHFFGTYVYQLPTHKCPFCMLQKEYYYVGYIIWATLFLGVFFGIANAVLKLLIHHEERKLYHMAILFNTIFVILCSSYVVVYYIQNGVWL
jgi:hypothetical protein